MPNFQILYLLFRTVEAPSSEKKPQFQVYFKSDETRPFKEERPHSIIRVKVLPQSELHFRLLVHKSDDVLSVTKSIFVQDLNLTPFEPKTFCLPFQSDSGENVFFIYDAFSYFIDSEEGSDPDNPTLFDFEFYKITGLGHLIEKVEKPLKKKHLIGFTMVEYEVIVSYLQQNYSFKFFANDDTQHYGRNSFVASRKNDGVLNVKLLANEYEWFVEGQNKTLRATQTLSEMKIELNEALKNEKGRSTLKLFGELEIEYSVRSRDSPFLKNFIGKIDFRVLSTSFLKEKVTNPTLTLRQLGTNIHWDLEPFSKSKDDNEYFWDFSFNKIVTESKPVGTSQLNNSEDFKSQIDEGSSESISVLDTPVHPSITKALDFLYQFEQDENDLEREELTLAYQKNGAFFMTSVPNDTIALEVYQNSALIGYVIFPLANMNMDQNFYEEIIGFGTDEENRKIGEVIVRVEFHPLNIQIDKDLYDKLQSLDFDDISERFSHSSKLYEAYLLMDKNLEKSKRLIWPDRITNSFKDLPTPKRLILNLVDVLNLPNIFSAKLNLNDLEIRVRISDVQQVLKFSYTQTTLQSLKSTNPKEYFLFTQTFYKQALVEQENRSTIIFQTNQKDVFGVITINRNSSYHHFDFTVQHPKETCSFIIASQGKILDYQIISLNALPLAEDVDTIMIPFKLPDAKDKNSSIKGSLFLKFQAMNFVEEEIPDNFSAGVFIFQRVKNRAHATSTEKSSLDAIYDFEIQTPQGLFHKIINLANDAMVDRTSFEHLAEIRTEQQAEIKLIVYKFIKSGGLGSGSEEQKRPVLFMDTFTLKGSKGESSNDPKVIALKPNYSIEKTIQIRDPYRKKGSDSFPLQLRFVYKVNKFVESPEGVLTVRLPESEMQILKQNTSLKDTNNFKIYLSDFNKEIKDSPSYIFMDRSLDDQFNQPKIQTYDWTNKLVVEAYGTGDVFFGRALIHLSEIPFVNQDEVIKHVVINGIRMTMLFSYKPLLSDDAMDEQSAKGSLQNTGEGLQTKQKGRNKTMGLIENIKQRIKDMENDNLVVRTNVNKINVIYQKKQRAIEKLEKFNANFEESKKAFSDTEIRAAIKLPAGTVSKAKELFSSICQCGKPAPKFKGYCGDCVKKLKEEYERCLQEYMPLAEKYEGMALKKHNYWRKKSAIEKKLQTYERKAKEFQFDFVNEEEELLKDEIKSLKATLLEKKNEIEIIQQEHYYKVEELKAKQKILENILAKKTKKLEEILDSVESQPLTADTSS